MLNDLSCIDSFYLSGVKTTFVLLSSLGKASTLGDCEIVLNVAGSDVPDMSLCSLLTLKHLNW